MIDVDTAKASFLNRHTQISKAKPRAHTEACEPLHCTEEVRGCKKRRVERCVTLKQKALFWPTLPCTYARLAIDGRGLWCAVDETLVLGVAPVAVLRIPSTFHAMGVTGIINMMTENEYLGPEASYAKRGIQQLNLPTEDHFEPSLEDLITAVEFIDKHRRRRGKVYVHCKAGHGRSAAVALAWLMRANNKLSDVEREALNLDLLSKRRVRNELHLQPNIRKFAEWSQDQAPLAAN